MQSPKFSRKIEDFACQHCGAKVKGDGFTNHCPKCLYSRHVDVNPGDRAGQCRGLMAPIAAEMEHGEKILVHRCEKCRAIKRNKVSEEDDLKKLIELMQTSAHDAIY